MTAQWGHCIQFLSSFCAEIFIAGLSDFDLHMLCHRFTPNGQLNRQYIERAILSGQLKVHPEIQQTDLNVSENTTLPGTMGLAGDISSKKQREKRTLITIRSDIKITLRQIVDQERIEAQTIEKQYQQQNSFGKSLAHVNHFATGFYTSGASFLTWMKDVNDVLSLNLRLLRIMQAAMAAENDNHGQRYQTFKQTLAESEKKELVEALGFDPAKISVDKLKQVYELANLTYEDQLTRILLTQFVKDYADAQHSLEWSEFSGGAAFEVILTALLAIATGGVGAIASLGAKARKISQLKKLGALFSELAEILKGLPKDKATSLRKLKEIEDKKKKKLAIAHKAPINTNPSNINQPNQTQRNIIRPRKYSNTKSMDPMFIGENKAEKHPFWGDQTVKYLDDSELESHELTVKDGKIIHAGGRNAGKPFDTENASSHASGGGSAIFVMMPDGKIYASKYHEAGAFHHSSLSQGNEVAAAGELVVENGVLKEVSNQSGHYEPSQSQNDQLLLELSDRGLMQETQADILRTGYDDANNAGFIDLQSNRATTPLSKEKPTEYIPKYWWKDDL